MSPTSYLTAPSRAGHYTQNVNQVKFYLSWSSNFCSRSRLRRFQLRETHQRQYSWMPKYPLADSTMPATREPRYSGCQCVVVTSIIHCMLILSGICMGGVSIIQEPIL